MKTAVDIALAAAGVFFMPVRRAGRGGTDRCRITG